MIVMIVMIVAVVIPTTKRVWYIQDMYYDFLMNDEFFVENRKHEMK